MKSNLQAICIAAFIAGLLAGCSPEAAAQAPSAAPPPADTAAPSAAATQAGVSAAAPTAPIHTASPGDFPDGKGIFIGDQSTQTSIYPRWALLGDRFTLGKFERPYNARKMDTYFPHLDIVAAHVHPGPEWTYVRLTMVGTDAGGGFDGRYAIELDMDLDGRGDLLIMAANPDFRTWSTAGVEVREDRDQDVGGAKMLDADSQGAGSGYEMVLVDGSQGQDPDLAWARLSHFDPFSVEVAFKTALLQGDDKYLAGVWAGSEALEPVLFDLNDHFTHEEAGAADMELPNFYPIKELAELDNTCRSAIGFTPTGWEPGLCPQG